MRLLKWCGLAIFGVAVVIAGLFVAAVAMFALGISPTYEYDPPHEVFVGCLGERPLFGYVRRGWDPVDDKDVGVYWMEEPDRYLTIEPRGDGYSVGLFKDVCPYGAPQFASYWRAKREARALFYREHEQEVKKLRRPIDQLWETADQEEWINRVLKDA